ncbi:MAG: succinate dehydrogenase cytochrome b subunit [Deltaproteobacteria bacterium]|nr:succinate dehydrogenase cytochrome b subunit [Deltaproteobacteria bacterium]
MGWIGRFWGSSIGKKAVMAVTGVILFGFLIGHMIGNLLVFGGPEKLNSYAMSIQNSAVLLWGVRGLLLVSVVLHIIAMIALTRQNRAARPVKYEHPSTVRATLYAKTMRLSGLLLLAYIIYHLLHFTLGKLHPNFIEGDAYHNMIEGFKQVPVSIGYIVAMICVGLHLRHGVWSLFQSVGLNHPRINKFREVFAALFAAILVLGNISMPVAVMAGWLK